ncbi:MAG: response regulator [Elusimicrobiota bacterium]
MAKKILLITDDAKNLKQIEQALAAEGFELDVAISSQEGILRATTGNPLAVILKSGEFSHDSYIKQLKHATEQSGTPVVVASSDAGWPESVLKAVKKALTPHRILIAEDDRQMAEILKSVLSHSGYEVRMTFDGAETLKEIKSWSPHLMVLDIMLPVMDGFHVCQAVSEDHTIEPKPRVLIISGRGSEWDQSLGSACGAEDYLVKPFTNAVFLEKVNGIFSDINI